MAISVRGSGLVYVNNVALTPIALPAGSAAGDYCVLLASHTATVDYQSVSAYGWVQLDNQYKSGTTPAAGAVFAKVLTAADITAGSVSVGFGNNGGRTPGYGYVAIIGFTGAAGFRTLISACNNAGAATRTIATDTTPKIGDYAVAFGTGWFKGVASSSFGTALQSGDNAQASAVLAGASLAAAGSVSDTFTYTPDPTFGASVADYEVVVVVAGAINSPLNLRAPLIMLEPLSVDSSKLRSGLVTVESLGDAYRNLRCSFILIESLYPVPEDGHVSTQLFPGSRGSSIALPGLRFTVHKRPTFSTAANKGVTGFSVRRANMQYPIWEFELDYEFLRDDVTNEYRTLRGFFIARKGAWDTFLFKDSDDYLVTGGTLGTADGTITSFPFLYDTGGGAMDLAGQVDNGNTITVYHAPSAEAHTIPNTPGPYTVTINHPQSTSATITQDLGVTYSVGGAALVAVGSAPAAGQYSVNLTTGVYTFNSADANKGVNIAYRYVALPANYTITMPNHVVFTTAPTTGTITADFQFFYNLKFQDDGADFEKFADKFWMLQKITLESVPQ